MARDWSEAEIGQAKRSPYHEPTQTNTPQTATAPTSAKDKHGTRDSQSRHTRLAGWEVPEAAVGETRTPAQNAAPDGATTKQGRIRG